MWRRYASRLTLLLFVLVSLGANASQPSGKVVDLSATDGTKLKATFFAAPKAGPGVLLLHQCNGQRKQWDDLASQLAAAGINVLTLDLRGFGESGGTPVDKATPEEARAQGDKWPGDIDVAFQYLQSQPGVKRDVIGLGGASCGVTNSVKTAVRHPKEVKSLVLLSGNANLAERNFIRESTSLPLLCAAAEDDEFHPSVDAVEWIYDISRNPGKKFIHYATGGHGAEMFAAHPELRTAIVEWYVTTLIKTPGRAPAIVAKDAIQVPEPVKMLSLLDSPGGASQAAKKLSEARKRDPNAVLFSEDLVNIIGYEYLQAGDPKRALEILKLNAEASPASANAQDSLGDAYLANGNKEQARESAKRALELLASDTKDPEARRNAIRDSAQQKLKQLGEGTP
ncbi:MAG TPA: alpha/beta fold hydrolase [Candidatus Limnocylindrales bacterium]|nr:alpha/beta fold hydrolase [Candidatus Limnocylindrales bacterium]